MATTQQIEFANAVVNGVFGLTNELHRLLSDRSIDDLHLGEFSHCLVIIKSLSHCLDSINNVSDKLNEIVRTDDPLARIAAVSLLAKLKTEDHRRLISYISDVLTSKDALLSRFAAEAIVYLGTDGVELVSIALRDSDWKVRHAGVTTAESFGSTAAPAVPELISILNQEEESPSYEPDSDEDELPQIYFRMAACDALRSIGLAANEAVPHLLNIIHQKRSDEDWSWLRLRAAHAHYAITDDPQQCITVSLGILEDKTPGVRAVVNHDGAPQDCDLSSWLRCLACEVLMSMGSTVSSVADRLESCLI